MDLARCEECGDNFCLVFIIAVCTRIDYYFNIVCLILIRYERQGTINKALHISYQLTNMELSN